MGERVYEINDVSIKFSSLDDSWRCLCTFPGNDTDTGPDKERVASLALFGAAVILALDNDIDDGLLPRAVPEWIRHGIIRAVFGDGHSGARMIDEEGAWPKKQN